MFNTIMISVRSVYSRVYSYVSSFTSNVDENVQTIQTVDDIV
ncbi:hypothetical protein EhV164_00015 [Emiliania huxleyi virus 164]|nr:hypothetical protein EhV164_00015 [Emiliania huxleyi virus 164]UKZ11025.1 hypothetical protein EhVM1_000010 [Emiliania huxleyi virus M1]